MSRIAVFVLVAALQLVSSKLTDDTSYADVRCKCICPREIGSNTTRTVFVATVVPDQCTCQHIVKREESFCLRCQCKYEARNTILIKVIIIFIIALLGVLIAYCVYLFVDSKRRPITLSISSDEVSIPQVQETLTERSRGRSFTMRNLDQRHSRWKREVAEQRRHIYDNRTMLS